VALILALAATAAFNADDPPSARGPTPDPPGAVIGNPDNGRPLPSDADLNRDLRWVERYEKRHETSPKPAERISRPNPGADPSKPRSGGKCTPDNASVRYADLPGSQAGEAVGGDVCRITIDPRIRAEGSRRVCTILTHERQHLAGQWSHTSTGLMRARLPQSYIAPGC